MRTSCETVVEHRGSTVLVCVTGELDVTAEHALRTALHAVPPETSTVLLDVHRVTFVDSAGLLLFLALHRRAEELGLRVLVAGWGSQPTRLMASMAALPADGAGSTPAGDLGGFRRLVEERLMRERTAVGKGPFYGSGTDANAMHSTSI
ncbi:STAS domain-containing protein [Streptomyces sp. NBC_00435]|uniref:STAS domain-containing protein n=1 Tax=Streptomyces sp. NBC_00435 TaxID=2903649 RepID=UPI002E1E2586